MVYNYNGNYNGKCKAVTIVRYNFVTPKWFAITIVMRFTL